MKNKNIVIFLVSFMLIGGFFLILFPSLAHTLDGSVSWSTSNNWTFVQGADTSVNNLSSYDGGTDLLWLNDSGPSTQCVAKHNWTTHINNGTIKIYLQVAQTNADFEISLISASFYSARIRFNSTGYIQRYGGAIIWNSLDQETSYNGDTWYIITLEFNCTSNELKVYLNGILKSTDPFDLPATYFDGIVFSSGFGSQGNLYIDWVDFSWAPSDDTTTGSPPIPGFEFTYILVGLIATIGIVIFAKKRKPLISS
ncbi:MAG: hypothetical protein EAX96_01970 [Candidatus Lokiarchaeota archaeon]|nr:hypothetical protein [Candidatus Lokiarchaeota archaeon]